MRKSRVAVNFIGKPAFCSMLLPSASYNSQNFSSARSFPLSFSRGSSIPMDFFLSSKRPSSSSFQVFCCHIIFISRSWLINVEYPSSRGNQETRIILNFREITSYQLKRAVSPSRLRSYFRYDFLFRPALGRTEQSYRKHIQQFTWGDKHRDIWRHIQQPVIGRSYWRINFELWSEFPTCGSAANVWTGEEWTVFHRYIDRT